MTVRYCLTVREWLRFLLRRHALRRVVVHPGNALAQREYISIFLRDPYDAH